MTQSISKPNSTFKLFFSKKQLMVVQKTKYKIRGHHYLLAKRRHASIRIHRKSKVDLNLHSHQIDRRFQIFNYQFSQQKSMQI